MRRWFAFVVAALFPVMVLAGPAVKPPGDVPPCLFERFGKMPDGCKEEIRGLVEDIRSLKLEKDALREELLQLRERLEKNKTFAGDEVRPLGDDEKSSQGYGETRWGMSVLEVKGLVSGIGAGKDENLLSVTMQVVDLPAKVLFGFVRGRLASVEVEFGKVDFAKLESLVEEYNRIKDLLSDKYDSPRLDEADLKSRGEAVGRKESGSGSLIEFTTTWETGKTEIRLNCQGNLSDVRMKIAYKSKEMALAEKQRMLKDL